MVPALQKHDRTKYKLAASIKECMKTTPVDRITVKDIVEGSGLISQTVVASTSIREIHESGV